ncbi:GUN4 domain-containing protein, partial [Nostoc sp. UIC 10890]
SKMAELKEELTFVSYTSGTDYRELQKLLVEQKWKEADQITYFSILRACGREQEGWLADGDIKKIPRHDLYIINHLWSKYSEGHFSFTMQKSILHSQRSFEDFAVKIGWMKLISNHHKFFNYDDYTFSLEAPQGNFPCTAKLVGLGCRSTSGVTNRIKSFLTWY